MKIFYEDIFRELNRNGVKYVVAGGVAVVLHGVIRLTLDLDLYVDLHEDNLIKFITSMGLLGYKPKVPVKAADFIKQENREAWKKEKNMKVFSFIHLDRPTELIDVFIEEFIKYTKVDKEKEIITADDIKIPIMSIKHLKQLKKIAGREQDLKDIQALDTVERLRKSKG